MSESLSERTTTEIFGGIKEEIKGIKRVIGEYNMKHPPDRKKKSLGLKFCECSDRLIEQYNPFFGKKFHEEEERSIRLAVNMVREGGIVNHLNYMGSYIPYMLYFHLMWPEIGIRAMYRQAKKLGK